MHGRNGKMIKNKKYNESKSMNDLTRFKKQTKVFAWSRCVSGIETCNG